VKSWGTNFVRGNKSKTSTRTWKCRNQEPLVYAGPDAQKKCPGRPRSDWTRGGHRAEISRSFDPELLSLFQYIEWSADSQLILSCCASQAQLEVWSVHRPEWKCRVQAGAFGIHSACFAPSSRHVLITSKLFVRLVTLGT